MISKSIRFLSISLTTWVLGVSFAHACPEILKNIKSQYVPKNTSICSLYDRYQAALGKLEAQGVTPADRLANLHAPRMINTPTWNQKRDEVKYSPWYIYNPAPMTWQKWESGAKIMQDLENENHESGSIRPMTYEILKQIHGATMNGLISSAGQFRDHGEVGMSLDHNSAIHAADSKVLLQSEYRSALNSNNRLVSWHATQCFEDRTEEFQKQFNEYFERNHSVDLTAWPDIDNKAYFKANDGTLKQCGYIVYADPKEVPQQMDRWMAYFNAATEALNTKKAYTADPIFVAARIQRWFISIHPFQDGNGRLSRFMMEYVIRSLGLPSPIFKDMDRDLYSTEAQWSAEIGRGIAEAVQVAETCAANPQTKGCNVVPLNP